ncbi:ScbR family autoregulator-binding transcription factor [Actinomadura fulvescens]
MQARADRTRGTMLRAAAEKFEANGYSGTRLQDIVAGRNLSKGALYFHFPSKKHLAAAIISEQADLWARLLAELRERHPRAIHLLPALLCRAAAQHSEDVMARASTRLAIERDRIGEEIPPLFASWTDLLQRLLAEAKEQGDLRPEVDPRSTAELIVATFTGLCQTPAGGAARVDFKHHLTQMWKLLLPGLATPECLADLEAAPRSAL